MNITVYCQHVVGIGHLCRMLQILKALAGHSVTLILGGPPVDITIPSHVHVVQLPGLMMDPEYTRMFPVDPGLSLEETKGIRKKILLQQVEKSRPDVLLIELYPFGRGGFHFELAPLLNAVRTDMHHSCPILCSLRDILVEKKNQQDYEKRVLKRLAPFDAVLVHGDQNVIALDETFSRTADIKIPVIYTGYICEKSNTKEVNQVKTRMALEPGQQLITVSAGGGSFGYRILEAAVKAHANMKSDRIRMQVFTGPYLDEEKFSTLVRLAAPGAEIERFAGNFPAWLAASDLSISMGGYNTTMNVVASGTPALIYPYGHDREQGMRTERLAGLSNLTALTESDLAPASLAAKIRTMIGQAKRGHGIEIDGARQTAKYLEKLNQQESG